MSDFKSGDKVRRPTWSPEFYLLIEWAGKTSYAGHCESGEECIVPKDHDWVLWTPPVPPFPFKPGDVIRRSLDTNGNTWEVVRTDIPGYPYSFEARYNTVSVSRCDKKCHNGEWELVPPAPVTKDFVLTTELRLAKRGEMYVYYGEVVTAVHDHKHGYTYVVTGVRDA